MTAAADFPFPGRGNDGAPAALWLSAATLALAVHGGAALWALHAPPPAALDAGAPAVMIEMAPAPAAPQAADEAPGEHLTDMSEIVETAQERLPDPTPPDMTLPEAEVAPPEPPSPLSAPPALLPEAALPPPADTPLARPRDLQPVEAPPPPKPDPKPQRKPDKPKAEAPPQTEAPREQQTRAASQTPQDSARPAGGSAGGGGKAAANWEARVVSHLQRRKRFPAAALARRETGRALIRFSIDQAGNVTSVKLVRSSGSDALDQEAVALARRASPVPVPPPGAALSITAPIDFTLR